MSRPCSQTVALSVPPARYEREAKDKNRESWYMAYIMDTNEEERAKVRKRQSNSAFCTSKSAFYISCSVFARACWVGVGVVVGQHHGRQRGGACQGGQPACLPVCVGWVGSSLARVCACALGGWVAPAVVVGRALCQGALPPLFFL